MSITQRIWKYRMHYLIVIPAVLFLIGFKIIPFFSGLYMSMVDYQFHKGLFQSEWVGLLHYARLFSGDLLFWQLLRNTLSIKFGYMLASGVLAFVLAIALSLVRSMMLRGSLLTLFLIPYFIPSGVFAYVVAWLLSEGQSPIASLNIVALAQAELFQPIIIAAETFKTCGIAIAIALSAISSRQASLAGEAGLFVQAKVIPAARAVAAFLLLQFTYILSGDFELLQSLLNPLVRQTGDTLETYGFNAFVMQMNTGAGASIQIILIIVQLVFAYGAYLLVKRYFIGDLFSGITEGSQLNSRSSLSGGTLAGTAVSVLYGLAVVAFLYLLFIYPFTMSPENGVLPLIKPVIYMFYLLLGFIAAIFHMIMITLLAYPLTVRRLPGKSVYTFFLILLAVLGSSFIFDFFQARTIGMSNTIFPIFLYGMIAIVPVFVLKSIFNSKYSDLKEQAEQEGKGEAHAFVMLYLAKMWKPILALGVLQFIAIWNAFIPSMMYMVNPNMFSPAFQFRALAQSGTYFVDVLRYGAIVSLPSVLLFLVFRRWITSEVLLGHVRKL
ncbi:hypothetical protein [Paenibacillus gorillae]|uniref:hypothetical protein n=1 Tax=Paenibacillus gorillae TaxID=1243662 RepID=UPI0004B7BF4E|nr:hypothetical protein [Paenibacillus gorillae]